MKPLPLPERPLRALFWLASQGRSMTWLDIVDASGGYRPSFHLVMKPLIDRALVREIVDPDNKSIYRTRFEPTEAGLGMIRAIGFCPTCGQDIPH